MANLSPVVNKTNSAKINDALLFDFTIIDLGTFGTNGDDYFFSYGAATYYGLGGNDTIIAGEYWQGEFQLAAMATTICVAAAGMTS